MCLELSGGDLIKIAKSHMRSTCQKLKSHARLSISQVRPSCEIPAKLSTLRIFMCDFLTLHLYYIYPHYSQKYERSFRKKNSR